MGVARSVGGDASVAGGGGACVGQGGPLASALRLGLGSLRGCGGDHESLEADLKEEDTTCEVVEVEVVISLKTLFYTNRFL